MSSHYPGRTRFSADLALGNLGYSTAPAFPDRLPTPQAPHGPRQLLHNLLRLGGCTRARRGWICITPESSPSFPCRHWWSRHSHMYFADSGTRSRDVELISYRAWPPQGARRLPVLKEPEPASSFLQPGSTSWSIWSRVEPLMQGNRDISYDDVSFSWD